ncbi:MAG TPA: tyrosine-type recombinase/integrase [Chloroflexota bacterium]|nr:tyrosine-type recombinase/integrase [Chloroflexota bacterium]
MKSEIESFFEYLESERGLAPNTLAAYRNDLSQFTQYISSTRAAQFLEPRNGNAANPVEPSDVSQAAIFDFFSYLRDERRYSAATIARKMAAVKSLYQFLLRDGKVTRSPVADLGAPEVKKALPRALSLEDVSNLMLQVENRHSPEGLRDCAMLRVLYATGMRVTELVSLDVGDVDLDQATILCTGRGKRRRTLPIDGDTAVALKAYTVSGRGQLSRTLDNLALFLNHRGQRLTRQGFWLIMKGFARDAGLSAQVTPHTLRHSFAAHRLSAGISLPHLRYLLGHANLSTTQIYQQLRDQDQASEPEPLAALSSR